MTLFLIFDKDHSLPPQGLYYRRSRTRRLTGIAEEMSRPGARRHLRESHSVPTW